MKKNPTEKDPLNEEMDPDVIQKQTPEIHITKGKKQRHKRDGCGGGGGGGSGGGGGGSAGIGLTPGSFGIGSALASFYGHPPELHGKSPQIEVAVDFEIVKAARDIPAGTTIKDKDLKDVSVKEFVEAGGKLTANMLTHSMAKNRSTTMNIVKGTFLKVDMISKKVTPIH